MTTPASPEPDSQVDLDGARGSSESGDAIADAVAQGLAADMTAPNGAAFPTWFGPYLLLRRLARGGMGDVCLAKRTSMMAAAADDRDNGFEGSIERLVVVKSLRANLTADGEYVRRFIDEARTVVQLNHKNICPVLDVGAVDGHYYMAMELIAGRDLRSIYERARRAGVGRVSEPVALFVVAQVCDALDYAHRLTDQKTGAPLGIVHRDVSPQNVMVSFEGEVKLIDFGLAQSALKAERTQPGIVLGKLAYMPAEQARGEPVDARSDVYATGVILYELLTGERYYEGLTLDDMWRIAGTGTFRPASLDRIPPELRAIVEKAVASDAPARFQTCRELERALHRYQVEKRQVATAPDVRAFMDMLFRDDELSDRRVRHELAMLAAPAVTDDHTETIRFAVSSSASGDRTAEVAVFEPPAKPRVDEATSIVRTRASPMAPTLIIDVAATLQQTPAPRGSGLRAVGVAAAVVLVVAVAVVAAVVAFAPRSTALATTTTPAAPIAPPATTSPVAPPAPTTTAPTTPTPTTTAPLVATTTTETPIVPATTTAPPPATTTTPDAGDEALEPEPVALKARPSRRVTTSKPEPPSSTPATVAIPEPPTGLSARVRWLDEHCKKVACASLVLAAHERWKQMSPDESRTHKQAVDACVAQCRP